MRAPTLLVRFFAFNLCFLVGWPALLFAADRASGSDILRATGVRGGIVVHLGCGDGKRTAELRPSGSYLVHGLDASPRNVAAAREHLKAKGLYGPVSVEQLRGQQLPYADNLINLVVVEDPSGISRNEVLRVLAPEGVAYTKSGDTWTKTVKPRPEEIDEWTHYMHGPDNNAVAKDSVVGPPNHLQWSGGPKWARGHEVLATLSAAVTAGGRIFYIYDAGPTASVELPSQWVLVARDAFNGLLLWKRNIPQWESKLRPFRSGPPQLPRRLVAIGDEVYVTLGYGAPLSALDAATGKELRTYEGTAGAEEILYHDGVLHLVIGDAEDQAAADRAVRRGKAPPPIDKHIAALEAKTGKLLWQKKDQETAALFALSLAVSGQRLVFENTQHVLCLDCQTGEELWRTDRPVSLKRPGWSVPTLVIQGNVVISADRQAPQETSPGDEPPRVHWNVSFGGGNAPAGEMIAFDLRTGKELWRQQCREGYNSPVDVLLADELLWSGDVVKARDPGITVARDPQTGEVKRKRPDDHQYFTPGMSHHRCYRNRATEKFLLLGRSGVEFVDVKSGKAVANHWIRGTCQFGVLPANGLLYVPPHTCACYLKTKLNGFNALASAQQTRSGQPAPQLVKGPAFGQVEAAASSPEDWPTFRHDPQRSGAASTQVPPQKLAPAWQAELGGRLSSITAAAGNVFVAQPDRHAVVAIDSASGKTRWQFTAGGRVDSPPTYVDGKALFGSADGHVYCLRASDGALVWRFRAAPVERRIVVDEQLESAWPVHGSVLVQNGLAYFAAGRSSYLDGGIYLFALDVYTGEVKHQQLKSDRDPETGEQPKSVIKGFDMPTGLPDVLSSDGNFFYMRDLKFDAQCRQQSDEGLHLFSPTGYLDDSWWHRSYWVYGTHFPAGWPGWWKAGYEFPAGRLLVFGENDVYGFGRNFMPPGNAGQWKMGEYYRLFAAPKVSKPSQPAQPKKRRRGRGPKSTVEEKWSKQIEPEVRAMLLSGETLFVAGPVGETHRSLEAFQGKEGVVLQAVSAHNGKLIAAQPLESLPVFDSMAAARGRLYLATQDGRVHCYTGNAE